MKNSELINWAAGVINAISLVLILLFTAVQSPTFMLSFYENEYAKNGTYETVQMEKDELMAVTAHMLDYMKGKEANLNIMTKVNGEDRLFFSEREIIHMKDVKDLFSVGYAVRNTAAALFVLSLAFLVIKKSGWHKYIFKSWKNVSMWVFITLAALGALISINFDNAFTIFHEIFFNNDLWLLDPNVDLLVNIVPTPFFIDIAVFVAVLFAFFLVGMFAVGSILNKKFGSLKNN